MAILQFSSACFLTGVGYMLCDSRFFHSARTLSGKFALAKRDPRCWRCCQESMSCNRHNVWIRCGVNGQRGNPGCNDIRPTFRAFNVQLSNVLPSTGRSGSPTNHTYHKTRYHPTLAAASHAILQTHSHEGHASTVPAD